MSACPWPAPCPPSSTPACCTGGCTSEGCTGSSGTGDAVGSLLSKIPLIGGALGGVVGGIISGIFGKSSSTITDAGLSISGTAAQMQQGQGVSQYADKTTTKKSWFSSSTKTSTILQDAGADVSRQFGLIFGGVSDSLQSAAGAMGQDAAAVARRLAGYVIDIPRLSLQGLNGDDLQEAISTAVGAKADEMARLVAPGLVDFQRIGEGYFETVVRVASATESAGETLRRLGVASVSLGQVVSKGAEDIGAEIVRQAGLGERWANVRIPYFLSEADDRVYLVGDITGNTPYPKSGMIAYVSGTIVARHLTERLKGKPLAEIPPELPTNICYSFVDSEEAIWVSANYSWDEAEKRIKAQSQVDNQRSKANGEAAIGWALGLWNDMFGPA